MAKKPKATSINVALLAALAAGENRTGRVTQAEGVPLLDLKLIEVNINDVDAEGKALARVTDTGMTYLTNAQNPTTSENASKPMFGIMKGVVIPPSQRGNRKGAGAPTQYPFADMEIGDSFFVPDSAKKGNAAKHLGSTVSQQNMHYRKEVPGKTETKTVTKRGPGNKAVKLPDGTNEKEQKTVPVYEATRRYVLRAVKAGFQLANGPAPENGALVAREM